VEVAGKLHHISVVLHQNALEASLKQVTRTKVPVVEFPGIGNTEPLHGLGEIGAVGPYEDVIVGGHQDKGKDFNLEAFGCLSDYIQEHYPIFIIQKMFLRSFPCERTW